MYFVLYCLLYTLLLTVLRSITTVIILLGFHHHYLKSPYIIRNVPHTLDPNRCIDNILCSTSLQNVTLLKLHKYHSKDGYC